MSMMKNVDQIGRQIYGGEKVIDQLYQDLQEGEDLDAPADSAMTGTIPKDLKKR